MCKKAIELRFCSHPWPTAAVYLPPDEDSDSDWLFQGRGGSFSGSLQLPARNGEPLQGMSTVGVGQKELESGSHPTPACLQILCKPFLGASPPGGLRGTVLGEGLAP